MNSQQEFIFILVLFFIILVVPICFCIYIIYKRRRLRNKFAQDKCIPFFFTDDNKYLRYTGIPRSFDLKDIDYVIISGLCGASRFPRHSTIYEIDGKIEIKDSDSKCFNWAEICLVTKAGKKYSGGIFSSTILDNKFKLKCSIQELGQATESVVKQLRAKNLKVYFNSDNNI